jgi:hypothetical protein
VQNYTKKFLILISISISSFAEITKESCDSLVSEINPIKRYLEENSLFYNSIIAENLSETSINKNYLILSYESFYEKYSKIFEYFYDLKANHIKFLTLVESDVKQEQRTLSDTQDHSAFSQITIFSSLPESNSAKMARVKHTINMFLNYEREHHSIKKGELKQLLVLKNQLHIMQDKLNFLQKAPTKLSPHDKDYYIDLLKNLIKIFQGNIYKFRLRQISFEDAFIVFNKMSNKNIIHDVEIFLKELKNNIETEDFRQKFLEQEEVILNPLVVDIQISNFLIKRLKLLKKSVSCAFKKDYISTLTLQYEDFQQTTYKVKGECKALAKIIKNDNDYLFNEIQSLLEFCKLELVTHNKSICEIIKLNKKLNKSIDCLKNLSNEDAGIKFFIDETLKQINSRNNLYELELLNKDSLMTFLFKIQSDIQEKINFLLMQNPVSILELDNLPVEKNFSDKNKIHILNEDLHLIKRFDIKIMQIKSEVSILKDDECSLKLQEIKAIFNQITSAYYLVKSGAYSFSKYLDLITLQKQIIRKKIVELEEKLKVKQASILQYSLFVWPPTGLFTSLQEIEINSIKENLLRCETIIKDLKSLFQDKHEEKFANLRYEFQIIKTQVMNLSFDKEKIAKLKNIVAKFQYKISSLKFKGTKRQREE